MTESRASSFLQMIRRSERGRLKVYLGYGPGVGKTYQMLLEGHRLKNEGIDVVAGVIESHGRLDTAKLAEGLPLIPCKESEYHGITLGEMDLDAILARKPQVVLVDELAHTNAPGSRNAKRYQDVQDLIAAGIHVIATLNVQHLESLYNTVERLINVKVRERLPDSVLADADQIVNVDLSTEDLQKRLEAGKVYPEERVPAALESFFKSSNLEQLRELTLRELASQIDSKRREAQGTSGDVAPDQVMVCLSSRGPNSSSLLRFASRLAGRLNRNWYAVYVQTPSEEPAAIDAATQRLLSGTLALANQLGAMVFTFKGADVAETIVRFAKEYRVGQIVLGRPRPVPWWKRTFGKRSVAEEIVLLAKGFTVVIVDAEADEIVQTAASPSAPIAGAAKQSADRAAAAPSKTASFGSLLDPEHILLFSDPVKKEAVLRELLESIRKTNPTVDVEDCLSRIEDREREGSTFLNEGVAFPHIKLEGITTHEVALGLTRAGISDVVQDHPIQAVVLILSPRKSTDSHVQILAAAARLMKNRSLRQKLIESQSPAEALESVRAETARAPGASARA